MIKIQRFRIYDLVMMVLLLTLFVFLLALQPRRECCPRTTLSNCTGNLKQLGNAAALYEQDNAGNRPGPQPWGPINTLVSWDRPLAIQMGVNLKMDEPLATLTKIPPYAGHRALATFTCQADLQSQGGRLVPAVPGSFADGTASGTGICRSYSLNLGSAGQEDGITATAGIIRPTKIESPASTVFLIENHGYATVFGQRNIANDTTIVCTREGKMVPEDAFANPAAPMHGVKFLSRANALMYDGHAEILVQADLTAEGGQIMQYIGDKERPAPPLRFEEVPK